MNYDRGRRPTINGIIKLFQDHTNMNEQNKIELGASTTGLINALRSFEQARRQYYNAYATIMGEKMALEQWEEEAPTWQAVADLIEKSIADQVRNWACYEDGGNII